jgi:hypothetical protein
MSIETARKVLVCLSGAMMVAWAVGCGDVSLSDLASSVKEAATEGVDQAKQAATEAAEEVKQDITESVSETPVVVGNADITLDTPIPFSACFAKFVHSKSGRPSVLQLQTYPDAERESFPSVFVRAQVSAASLAELAGQTVAAQMFVQPQQDEATWATTSDLVQLKVTSVDETMLSAEIVDGSLFNTATGTVQPVKGTLNGALR